MSHSAGTLLALEYLRAHPNRVEKLVMVGALPHKNGSRYFDEEYASLWEGLAEDAEAFWSRPEIEREIERAGLAGDNSPRGIADANLIRQVGSESVRVDLWRQALPVRVNPDAARRTRETTNFEYDYSDPIGSHPFPITVINGELDWESPVESSSGDDCPSSRCDGNPECRSYRMA